MVGILFEIPARPEGVVQVALILVLPVQLGGVVQVALLLVPQQGAIAHEAHAVVILTCGYVLVAEDVRKRVHVKGGLAVHVELLPQQGAKGVEALVRAIL